MSKYVTRVNESFESNPWVDSLATTIKKGNQITAMGRSSRVVDSATGEVSDSEIAMVSKKVVDKEEFIKIFEGGISNIFDLTKSARDLFRAVLQMYLNQKMAGEKIYVSDVTLKEVGYAKARSTKNNALNQLLKAGFIAKIKGEQNWYWVNPNMFYKGNRITLINQLAVEGTAEGEQLKEEQADLEAKSQQTQLPFF